MTTAPPPEQLAPVLDTLARYARAFDEISEADEGRPRYSARAFVEFVRREVTAPRREAA